MPVLMIFKWKGDPDALVKAYDDELEHAVAREQPRRLSHTCASAADGMVIVDVWESEDAYQEMMDDPEFQRLLSETPTPAADILEVYQIHLQLP
jgi:hypothetical protein